MIGSFEKYVGVGEETARGRHQARPARPDEQIDHRRGLVGDRLDAGRIDTGTLAVSPEPAEVAGLVDRARTTCLSAGGRHMVLIDLPPDRPRAMADRRQQPPRTTPGNGAPLRLFG